MASPSPPWACLSCCREFWIPTPGASGPHCLGILGYVPTAVALIVFILRYALRSAWHHRPFWLRNFAAEAVSKDEEDSESPLRKKEFTAWSITLFLLALASTFISVAGAVLFRSPLHSISLIPDVLSAVMLLAERPQSTPASVLTLNAFVFFDELAAIALAPPSFHSGLGITWQVKMVIRLVTIAAILNMPLRDRRLHNDGISKPFTTPTSQLRSPEDDVTLWQWMSVSWMAPMISIGIERQIHDEDVWMLPYVFQHDRLHHLFRELKGSVIGRLLMANSVDLMITTGLGILETTLEVGEVLFLKQLLAALAGENPNPRLALLWAFVILFGRLVRSQSGVFSLWFCRRTYERSRGEMVTMIYEKTLRRKAFTFGSSDTEKAIEAADARMSGTTTLADSSSEGEDDDDLDANKRQRSPFKWLTSSVRRIYAKVGGAKRSPPPPAPAEGAGPASTGKILNLMRNDVYEVAQRFWEFPSLFTKPLNFILSLVLVWQILGPSALLGIFILVACQLLNVYFMRLLLQVERSRRAITDTKLQRTTQFVESIRHLRWYDWQDKWLAGILESRDAELRKRVISNILNKTIATVNQIAAFLFPVAGFVAYTLIAGRQLTVDIAFPALDLFSMLQNSLRELPDLLTVLLNSRVAMGRIQSFVDEPNKEDVDDDDNANPPGKLEIEMDDASFSWPGSKRKVLRHVSIRCQPGLTVVCGKVGIGKTALLQAILGELDQHAGEKYVPREMIGYSNQSPWLQSMSIRQNILFSSEYDKVRYRQTLDACCLTADLASFKAGDRNEVGENGIGLSGGQRARVALARALYSPARILLLDDPIAALDHQTADTILRKLFSKKNSPLTAGRLVIFVTHRVDLITRYADQVLDIVDGGMVKTIGREELDTSEELQHLAARAAIQQDVAEEEIEQVESNAIPDKFVEEEYRAHGGVMASVYWKYVKAGGLWWWIVLIAFFVAFRVARIIYLWFLKVWGEAYGPINGLSVFLVQDPNSFHAPVHVMGASFWDQLDFSRNLPSPADDVHPWLIWFFVISMAQVVAQAISDFVLVVIIYNAGKNLFQQAMRRVTNATFRFYDVTPVGRLMNRLTSDIGTVDGQIAYQLMTVAWFFLSWLSSVFVIASTTPLFLVLTLGMTAVFVYIFLRFLPASQSLRRLEMVSLSPLMTNFGTLVEGLTTVRAFKAQPHFQTRIIETTDDFQKMDHYYWSLQSWLQYRFDMLSALTTFTLTVTALYTGLSSGTIGFVLAAASNFVQSTHYVCRRYGELQMQFVSVERVIELLDLEEEAEGTIKPSVAWPGYKDDIVFDHVTLRYAPGLEPSLRDVSFSIPAGSSVAVTGRTGSGKSTLALSLLATILPDEEYGGAIRIGNVDLATVDKHRLRRGISFVAQDPVLFPGTLRDNLDPVSDHTDEDCAAVLERVLGSSGQFTLQSRVDGGGKNLSQGQRQLVGLGRAILRRSPVVIMDEATASIDVKTAFEIQEVLRDELRDSTVITIAHRVEAVRDANYEVVLEKGRILRCGPLKRP